MTHSYVSFLLLSLFVAAHSPAAVESVAPPAVQDVNWTPIKDLSDPRVVNIADYALTAHNTEAHSLLQFNKVIQGESSQGEFGTTYKLIIEAKDEKGALNKYMAIVRESDSPASKELISFKAIDAHA